jgi:hypothetical protein
MAFSQQSYQGQGIEQPRERSRIGLLMQGGIAQAGNAIGQGIQNFNRNKAEAKMLRNFYQTYVKGSADVAMASPDADKDSIKDTMNQALARGEEMGLSELRGWKDSLAVMEAKRQIEEKMRLQNRQDQRAQNADVRAQEAHQLQKETIEKATTQEEQTNNVLMASIEEPKPVTTINAPVPGMDKVSGRTAPEVPTVETKTPSRREMLMDAFKKNPKARVGDILKQLGSGQPSITDQIAVKKYNDSVTARTVKDVGLARTPEAAKELIEFKTTVEDTNKGVDGLLKILGTTGKAFSPKLRAEAETLTAMLKGSLRLAIVGPGAMSESEIKLLDRVVANPTSFKKTDGQVKAALTKLKSHLADQLETRYKNNIEGYEGRQAPDAIWSGYGLQ